MITFVIKPILYIVLKRNNGFTMIEMMLSLTIITMIMSILPLIYIQLNQFSGKSTDHFDVNNALFQRDLTIELKSAEYVEIHNGEMHIFKGDDIIQILYHNQRIIRKINNSGYIIMLEGVNNARFEENNHGVFLTIERLHKGKVVYQII
ncbi:competence type IV pilus minor pilin ComGF [Macrococcoides caseolyticum]|uniref:competence type IV pilus minor pilin ComGF n=1 Tax=Macrococcoides caseolyticum TaxID=69966 RepID=UPI001F1CDE26|nr:competence type IV pilus minor pilin ComGF [Macrococcus caseolyticus]MCE4956106.1 prepilin-type N-terminal cleavage/methylation domain-containing protein [Macrococcus caseolyticus]